MVSANLAFGGSRQNNAFWGCGARAISHDQRESIANSIAVHRNSTLPRARARIVAVAR
jgi:hypothetical protein